MKINKHRRLGKIIQILERWAPLETSEVSQSLAHIFDISEAEIKRNVSNDLKFLRDEGELIPLYFNKFGELISREIEPEDGSFYRIKWQLRNQDGQHISGAHELNRYSSFIMASEDLQSKVYIRQGLGKSPQDWHFLYFDLNNELYHLAIPRSAVSSSDDTVEYAIGLCRSQSQYPENLKRDFTSFANSAPGKSHILISLKDPFISSMDAQAPIVIELMNNGAFNVSGTANKNSLEFIELPNSKAEDLLRYLSLFKDQTQTTHWTDMKEADGLNYREGSGKNLMAPLLLRIKESSGFLIH